MYDIVDKVLVDLGFLLDMIMHFVVAYAAYRIGVQDGALRRRRRRK